MSRPAHHRPDGRFQNPWPEAAGDDALRRRIGRVVAEWVLEDHPADPPPHSLSPATPALANPHTEEGSVRVTWVGHATSLVQLPGLNVLTDPVWSERSSPVGFAGPRRFVPAVPALHDLPTVDAVLLSHDHYDHLDRRTVRALRDRGEVDTVWLTPLRYRHWFARQGIRRVEEHDWWESVELPGGRYRAVCVPARHWTRRRPGGTNRRLWCGWAIVPTSARGPRLYFAGDSGYGSFFSEIGRRLGPFHASLMPIGAYEPRWFMAAAHMNPEEAVQAYRELGGEGAFVGMHWGTWRLTFEDPLEPPLRTKAAWEQAGLPGEDLHLLRHGETLVLRDAGF